MHKNKKIWRKKQSFFLLYIAGERGRRPVKKLLDFLVFYEYNGK